MSGPASRMFFMPAASSNCAGVNFIRAEIGWATHGAEVNCCITASFARRCNRDVQACVQSSPLASRFGRASVCKHARSFSPSRMSHVSFNGASVTQLYSRAIANKTRDQAGWPADSIRPGRRRLQIRWSRRMPMAASNASKNLRGAVFAADFLRPHQPFLWIQLLVPPCTSKRRRDSITKSRAQC